MGFSWIEVAVFGSVMWAAVLLVGYLSDRSKKWLAIERSKPQFVASFASGYVVLVRADDYRAAKAVHDREVEAGSKSSGVRIVVHPTFVFAADVRSHLPRSSQLTGGMKEWHDICYESIADQAELTWEYVRRRIRWHNSVNSDAFYMMFSFEGHAYKTVDDLYVPFASKRVMSYDEQTKLFPKYSYQDARDYLLGRAGLPDLTEVA